MGAGDDEVAERGRQAEEKGIDWGREGGSGVKVGPGSLCVRADRLLMGVCFS